MNLRFRSALHRSAALLGVVCATLGAGCAQPQHSPAISPTAAQNAKRPPGQRKTQTLPTTVTHVVIIVQENRSVDNLFQKFRGADVQSYGRDSHGNDVTLQSRSLTADCDPHHEYEDWLTEYNAGLVNGFDLDPVTPASCVGMSPPVPYSYVPQGDAQQYFDLANEDGLLLDHVFQGGAGPSLPAHKYLIAGQSGAYPFTQPPYNGIADNPPTNGFYKTSGCDNKTFNVKYLDFNQQLPLTFTPSEIAPACTDEQTIFDQVDTAYNNQINWRFYTPQSSIIWNAPFANQRLYNYKKANDIVDPDGTNFAADVANGDLAPLTFIVPCPSWSDHPHDYMGGPKGPDWVAYLVDTLFGPANAGHHYWDNTVVFVVWDDWGGWYDHLENIKLFPNAYNNQQDPYENGFRTPVIVVSEYVNPAMRPADHQNRNTGSILAATEWLLNLPLGGLGVLDKYSSSTGGTDYLNEVFEFTHPGAPFTPISYSGFPHGGTCPNATMPDDFDG